MTDFDPTSAVPRRARRRRFRLARLLVLAVVVAATVWFNGRTYHLAAVQDGVLYRCGNRGIGEFTNALNHDHIRTVVSLIDDSELNDPNKPQFKDEAKYLNEHGIRQERIAVPLGGWPSGEQIATFLSFVSNPTNQPVLVHCAQGVRRTGMFVAAYQESVMGYNSDKAKDAIETFGHSDRTAQDIRAFIDDYDPINKTMATTRPATGNE